MKNIREKEVLTSSTQDLRQNMIREKVPLQGTGDGEQPQMEACGLDFGLQRYFVGSAEKINCRLFKMGNLA